MRDFPDIDMAVMRAVARYCHALHFADGQALAALCDAAFLMHWIGSDGVPRVMDRAAFVARVANRAAFSGQPVFDVISVAVDGDEIAQVKLNVAVPPRTYIDQLGFFRVGDEWRLVTNLFRVAAGPAVES